MNENVQSPISLKNINYAMEIIQDNNYSGRMVILLRENDPALNIHLLHNLYDFSEFDGKSKLESIYGVPVVYIMGDVIKSGHFAIVVIRP